MKYSLSMLLLVLLAACNENESQPPPEKAVSNDTMKVESAEDSFSKLQFAANTDVVCGMPVTAGIHDTAHYKDGIYGFCSNDCKKQFLKDPASFLTKK